MFVVASGPALATPLDRRQYRAAIVSIEAVLQTHDEPLWYARLGTAKARLGLYDHALAAFALGFGSPFYEREGWRDHANVLRAVGRCREAADLRTGFVAVAADPGAIWLDIAEDWRACGARDRARDAVAAAEARSADPAEVHAILSDLNREEGHWGAAHHHLEEAFDSSPSVGFRPLLSAVHHRMQLGDWVGAEKALSHIVLGHMRDPRIFMARTELWLATGRIARAVRLANRGPWNEHEDPLVVCRRAEIYRMAGDPAASAHAQRQVEALRGPVARKCPSPRGR